MAKVKLEVSMDKFKLKQREILRGVWDVDMGLARLHTTACDEAEFVAGQLMPTLVELAKARRRARIKYGVYAVRVYVIAHNRTVVKLG